MPDAPEDAEDVAAAIKAALAKEERALHESENKNVLAALQAIPSRASAALTASGFVATALVAVATLLARPWLRDAAKWALWQYALAFVLAAAAFVTLYSVAQAVWIILGALPPVDLENPLPKEDFIEVATRELSEDEIDTAIDLYITKITRNELEKNKHLLAQRIADFRVIRRRLRCAHILALLLFIFGVIIRVGSGGENDVKANSEKQPHEWSRTVPRDERREKSGQGGAPPRGQLGSVGQILPGVESKPNQADQGLGKETPSTFTNKEKAP